MKKKTKQKTLWFLFLPENDEWADTVVASLTRKVLRNEPKEVCERGGSFCADVFRRLMGFLPKVPTKITLTWEE